MEVKPVIVVITMLMMVVQEQMAAHRTPHTRAFLPPIMNSLHCSLQCGKNNCYCWSSVEVEGHSGTPHNTQYLMEEKEEDKEEEEEEEEEYK